MPQSSTSIFLDQMDVFMLRNLVIVMNYPMKMITTYFNCANHLVETHGFHRLPLFPLIQQFKNAVTVFSVSDNDTFITVDRLNFQVWRH